MEKKREKPEEAWARMKRRIPKDMESGYLPRIGLSGSLDFTVIHVKATVHTALKSYPSING